MNILLNDEEVNEICNESGASFYAVRVSALDQLKKVAEWGDGECFEHPYTSRLKNEEYNRKHHRCPECWQVFLKEVK